MNAILMKSCDIEGVERITYEDTIRYAKENNLYDKTMSDINILVNAEIIDNKLYKSLLD